MAAADYIIVGGGIVGASIAYGLARAGESVTLLDQGDVALRAARGNLGNVWVQGKGVTVPDYADLTRQAALDWPQLAAMLQDETGIDLHFRRPGAAFVCFTEEELQRRGKALAASNAHTRIKNAFEVLDRDALAERLPMLGPDVAGGTFSPDDGAANPLFLLRALIAGFIARGGRYLPRHTVTDLARDGQGFVAQTAQGAFRCGRIVLASGLGNAELAPKLGLSAPVRPVRGQILITEKLQPFLPVNVSFIRQTVEGGCIIGESSEEVGTDDGTTLPILRETARRAITVFPMLARARVVRAWGALRIMTPTGVPVYQSRDGAFVVCVHSGVTLAPWHAMGLIPHLVAGRFNAQTFRSFQPEDADVPAA